ncbi:MAG: transcriptional regulator [Rhodomicrobium sp.]|nr:MAG: transcriptional regulator [Rhodomicrobium sp.]
MDINLIKTYLAIVESGSFVDAADKIHITQSTVSSRIKNLEQQLGQPLFHRSKAGATLTQTGEQFYKHAIALLRVWEHARLDVGLAEEHQNHISIGGQVSLWDGFLLSWLVGMRRNFPESAITATMGHSSVLLQRLVEGTLDIAVLYRPTQRPGLILEHIFDEELVLVTSNEQDTSRPGQNYVLVNWGPEFMADHAAAYPEMKCPALNLDLGALAITYLLEEKAAGYFPIRTSQPYIESGKLKLIPRAPRFVYPVYAVYNEVLDDNILPALETLRTIAADF